MYLVHLLRAEVHQSVTALENARREVRSFEDSLLPHLQESLRLADEAIAVREVTLVEILTAQRQVLGARRNYLEARIERARAQLMVDTVSGTVLMDRSRGGMQSPAPKEEGGS